MHINRTTGVMVAIDGTVDEAVRRARASHTES